MRFLLAGGNADVRRRLQAKLAPHGHTVPFHWDTDKPRQWAGPVPQSVDQVIYLVNGSSHSQQAQAEKAAAAAGKTVLVSKRSWHSVASLLGLPYEEEEEGEKLDPEARREWLKKALPSKVRELPAKLYSEHGYAMSEQQFRNDLRAIGAQVVGGVYYMPKDVTEAVLAIHKERDEKARQRRAEEAEKAREALPEPVEEPIEEPSTAPEPDPASEVAIELEPQLPGEPGVLEQIRAYLAFHASKAQARLTPGTMVQILMDHNTLTLEIVSK